MGRPRAQLDLFPTPRGPRIPEVEKQACRERQGGRCATCDGTSRGGIALDVVRRDGALVAFCRRHRLVWDAPWRCAKGSAARRRGSKLKPPAATVQLHLAAPR